MQNVATAERVERPPHGHDGPIRAIRLVHRDGASPLLASVGNDGTGRLWNIEFWTPHGEPLTGHHSWVWSPASVPGRPGQGQRPASAGADGTVRLRGPLRHRRIGEPSTVHTDQVRAVTLATRGDGRGLLVSGGLDGAIRLWHPVTGRPVPTIPLGIPIHALLQQVPDDRACERTDDGATITLGPRTGVLALDLGQSLFAAGEGWTGTEQNRGERRQLPAAVPDPGQPLATSQSRV